MDASLYGIRTTLFTLVHTYILTTHDVVHQIIMLIQASQGMCVHYKNIICGNKHRAITATIYYMCTGQGKASSMAQGYKEFGEYVCNDLELHCN